MWFNITTFVLLLSTANLISAFVHPITIHGRYFIDSVTKEPFYLKGIDYQPGGSSGVTSERDPLSDKDACTRDIVLFQELGINTLRVYSINPNLNHDHCMTLLATAGIYLVLDVNSPIPNQHLNRYDPWTTYNIEYLKHVFKVVEQFSYYNNTLGFFAGNEIINDKDSANYAATYIKALIRDMKMYINYNSPRIIPVGYSAADDLNYRVPLSDYLECTDQNPIETVDFYGVNSYQWCGEQTFYTSGYNTLVDDYLEYARPVFFSEYGCNEVTPRIFDEVQSMYSNDMVDVFSGGLVYEFSQEPNNYGLVEHQENGDVHVLSDFNALKTQYQTLPDLDYAHIAASMKKNSKEIQGKIKSQGFALPKCEKQYRNLDISKGLPKSLADDLIDSGVDTERGKYISLTDQDYYPVNKIFDQFGLEYDQPQIEKIIDIYGGIEKVNRKNSVYRSVFHSDGERNMPAKLLIYIYVCVVAVDILMN